MDITDLDREAGKMVKERRQALHMSQTALALALGLSDHATISHWENGKRSFRVRDDQLIRTLAVVLRLQGPNLALLSQASGIPDLRGPVDNEADAEEIDNRELLFKRWLGLIGEAKQYQREVVSWGRGRIHQLHMHTYDAITAQEPARQRAYTLIDLGDRTELTNLILQDAAVSHITAGKLDAASPFVTDGRLIARDRRKYGAGGTQQAAMGFARALIAEQMIAYLEGDRDRCDELRREAIPWLKQADDEYGWAKSIYLCAKLRFYQGDLLGAYHLAKDAHEHAAKIKTMPRSAYWLLRDGLLLGVMWWRVIAENFLFDMVVCMGEESWNDLGVPSIDDWVTKLKPWWTRDFPPFRSHYRWVADLRRNMSKVEIEQRFNRWIENSNACGNIFELPCIYISFGDYFLGTHRPRQADEQYREAERVATYHGFTLHKDAATSRRTRVWLPPVVTSSIATQAHS